MDLTFRSVVVIGIPTATEHITSALCKKNDLTSFRSTFLEIIYKWTFPSIPNALLYCSISEERIDESFLTIVKFCQLTEWWLNIQLDAYGWKSYSWNKTECFDINRFENAILWSYSKASMYWLLKTLSKSHSIKWYIRFPEIKRIMTYI